MYNTGLIWMMWTGTPCILRMVQILHLVRYSFPVVSMPGTWMEGSVKFLLCIKSRIMQITGPKRPIRIPICMRKMRKSLFWEMRLQGSKMKARYFLGWSTTPNGTVDSDYTVGETFVIRNNVDLYAVWGDELPTTGTLTVTKTVSGHALPADFHIPVKNSSNQVVYTLGLTSGDGVIGPDANTTYTDTLRCRTRHLHGDGRKRPD